MIPDLNLTLETVEALGAKALDENNINHLMAVCKYFEGSMRRSLESAGIIPSGDLENTDRMVEEMRELLKRAKCQM